jgi:quercetin dioxygenase-like cupin family protein
MSSSVSSMVESACRFSWSLANLVGRGDCTNDYDEIVYVIAGRSNWIVGDEQREAGAGDVRVVRAGEPHKFVCANDDPARQIDIHLSGMFETMWLE